MEDFYTILKEEQSEIVEKKSKFIANIYPVVNIEDAQKKIKDVNKKYYDAKHHCIAYRVLEDGKIIDRFSDDGEPSGTAGAPMLNLLQANKLCNVLVVVTRYFGGILLGTGGLVRAYSEATNQAIRKCDIICKTDGYEIYLITEYSNLDIFKYFCKNNNIKILNIEYSEKINIKIEIESNKKEILIQEIENKVLSGIVIVEIKRKMINKVENK